jgi:hypothetical protein
MLKIETSIYYGGLLQTENNLIPLLHCRKRQYTGYFLNVQSVLTRKWSL